MIKTFEKKIYDLIKKDPRIVLITADSAPEICKEIKKEFPGRCYDFGIAECNAVGIAAGMANTDCIPIIYIQDNFVSYRALEFIRNDICFQKKNVKIVAFATGFIANTLGPSHHATEDIGVLRSIPNLVIVSPASCNELISIMDESLKSDKPMFIRIGKAFEREVYNSIPEFKIGKNDILLKGEDITIVCTGSIIADAKEASLKLNKLGFSTDLINISTIKPFDSSLILNSAKKTRKVVVVEEHNIIGGLGSCVAEALCGIKLDFFECIGINDTFCDDYGWHQDLKRMYNLSPEAIYDKICQLMNKK